MRIVLVNLDFPPIGGPGVWRIAALAKYMALAGHQVTVVCSDRSSWHSRIDPSLLNDLPSEIRIHRIHSLFLKDILRLFHQKAHQTSWAWLKTAFLGIAWRFERYWPNPVIFWALKAAFKTMRLAKDENVDCIITSGPQHLSHLSGYLSSKRSQVKWVMDFRDPWTRPIKNSDSSYQYRLSAWLENKFIQRSDRVVVVSPTWLDDIAEGFQPKQRKKFVLKLNGHDIRFVPLASRSKSVSSRTVIHFNGMLAPGTAEVFPTMLQALHIVERRGIFPDELKITFCGIPEDLYNGSDEETTFQYIGNIGALSHDEAIQQCLCSDALLVIVSDDPFYRGMIPGKLYEAIALGKHIVAVVGQNSDVRSLLEGYPHVTYANSSDADSVADTLISIALSTRAGKLLSLPSEIERQAMAEKFSRQKQADDYVSLIEEVLSE
tara:strand:+ start:10598 stop:11899 length:1302 start_codon:yes stop_codon:yes gene_type:complete